VPGELRGLQHISDTYGRLPWRHLLRPAITLAKRGFPVGHDLVRYMDFGNTSFLVNDLAWSQDFAPNGTRVGIGDYMTRRRYAHVLEKIAKHGAETFYTGDIAETTTAAIKQAGGIITKDDLASYTVKIRTPLSISYRDFRIIGCEAPSSGAVTLSAMKVIEGYNDIGNPELVNLNTHRIIEAAKFGYGMRPELGDPSFLNGSRQYQERMISAQIANQHRAKLSDYHTLNTSEYNIDGLQNPYDDGTSHMVAADNEGMVISLTTTINNPWGSYIIVNDTGIILNNQMNDFSVPGTANGFGYVPAPANFIRPGKTPLSSMSPVIIEHLTNSTFYLATGSAGGSRIITAVLQILWNVLDRSLDVKEALSTPRFHDQLVPNQTLYEYAYDNDTVGYLSALGHNATWVAPGATEAEAIRRTYNGAFEAAADPNLIEGAGIIL
jgi:gamma-glutamyltranspeptidase/glutathione hydrolase